MFNQNRNFKKNLCESLSIRGFLNGPGNMASIVFQCCRGSMVIRIFLQKKLNVVNDDVE